MAEHAPASDPLKISNKILATISPAAARVLLVPVVPLSSTSLRSHSQSRLAIAGCRAFVEPAVFRGAVVQHRVPAEADHMLKLVQKGRAHLSQREGACNRADGTGGLGYQGVEDLALLDPALPGMRSSGKKNPSTTLWV
jgi:hypothetical protein